MSPRGIFNKTHLLSIIRTSSEYRVIISFEHHHHHRTITPTDARCLDEILQYKPPFPHGMNLHWILARLPRIGLYDGRAERPCGVWVLSINCSNAHRNPRLWHLTALLGPGHHPIPTANAPELNKNDVRPAMYASTSSTCEVLPLPRACLVPAACLVLPGPDMLEKSPCAWGKTRLTVCLNAVVFVFLIVSRSTCCFPRPSSLSFASRCCVARDKPTHTGIETNGPLVTNSVC